VKELCNRHHLCDSQQTHFFDLNMCQIVFTARALPRTPLGSSQRSLGPLAGFTRERREKRGREGNDRKGGKGKGVKEQKEGEMRKEREGTSVLSQLIMGCAAPGRSIG